MTKEERLHLIGILYARAYLYFDSFQNNNVGAHLMYLVGAICEDQNIELDYHRFDEEFFIDFLKHEFVQDHAIWAFIVLE